MEPTAGQPLCRIEMLGGLRVRQGERLILRFPTYKTGALLAYLAYYRQRDAAREMLIEMFWPDYSGERARNNLSAALSALRTYLDPPGAPAGTTLIADRHTIRMNADHVTSDVHEFVTALKGSQEGGEESAQAERMAAAIRLYTGELLPGYYEDWIVGQREHLAESYVQALRSLVRFHVKRKEMPVALEYAQQAVSADATREEAHRDLIKLFVATGQLSAALQQYREMESVLEKTMGASPSPTSRQLLHEIEARLKAEPEVRTPAPVAARPVPLPAAPVRPSYPTGIVTLILAEVETPDPSEADRTQSAQQLRALVQAQSAQQGGRIYRETPQGLLVAFAFASKALECGLACLRTLTSPDRSLSLNAGAVRLVLHTGEIAPEDSSEADERTLEQATRLLDITAAGQVACSEATAILLRQDLPDGVQLADTGIAVQDGTAQGERLFRIDTPDTARRETTPPRVVPASARTLPAALNRFFGRQAECRQLVDLFRDPQTRLVTLLGMGGAGKTRLAQEVATSLQGDFPGAVWWLSLADLSDAENIPRALAKMLRLPPSPQEDTLDQVIAALEAKPALLVLDNFEQLVEAGTTVVSTLLAQAPDLKLLVTSRQILGLTGEHEFPLAPLAVPGLTTSLYRVMESESVQLFVDRAQTARPDFRLTEANAGAVAALCNRLEGLPLAIELAAARSAVLAPEQMLKQLEDRFTLLVSRKRDLVERHRTLRATLEWSYALLEPDLRDFFARLCVFRGGWTVEAAEVICAEPLALDLLAQLRECSLLQTVETDAHIRFRMLETVREFAALHIQPEDLAERRLLHRNYFLEFAEAMPIDGAQAEQAAVRTEEELENLRAALAYSDVVADAETTLRLANALCPFWKLRGFYREGGEWLARATDECLPLTPQTRAAALHGAGTLAYLQGRYAVAAQLLERCLPLRREAGDLTGESATLLNLGAVAYYQNEPEKAHHYFEASIALRRQCQDFLGVADGFLWLGNLARRRGDLAEAQRLFGESLVLFQNKGSHGRSAAVLNNLGVLAHELGQMEMALSLYQQCLDYYRQIGNKAEIAHVQNNRGNVLREIGRTDEATDALLESVDIWRELENPSEVALALNTLGLAYCAQRDYNAARGCFLESWIFYKDRMDREGLAYALTGMAEIALGEDRPAQAVRLLAQADRERTELHIALPPGDQRDWNRVLTHARTALPPSEYQAAWQIGAATPLALEAGQPSI